VLTFLVKNGKMKLSGESIFREYAKKLKVKSRNSAKTIREYTSAILENQIKYGACESGFGSGIEVLPNLFFFGDWLAF